MTTATKATHTPGPWKNSGPTWRHSSQCWSQAIRTPKVAEGLAVGHTAGGSTREEAEANAHLIAAAPDLLEALQTGVDNDMPMTEWLQMARAAIAKATNTQESK